MTAYSLPSVAKLKASNFRLQRMQAFNPVRGGHHQTVDLGEPLWVCDIQTTPLSREQAGLWRALALRLRGKARTVYIYDAAFQRPAAYPSASADLAWLASSGTILASSGLALASGAIKPWGAPSVVEYDRTNSLIRLVGLVPYAVLTAGDFAAWDDGPARRLAQVVESVAAGADGAAWVQVEPAPPSTQTYLPAPVSLEKAAAEMVLMEFSAPYQVGNGFATVSATAVQILNRS